MTSIENQKALSYFQARLSYEDPKEIRAFEYVDLSYLYIKEGNFEKALSIMQLATARGHMESIVVVMQSWVLLKRLNREEEAENRMSFLLQSVPLIPRPNSKNSPVYIEDSSLQLSHIYLICSFYLKSLLEKSMSKRKRFRLTKKFQSFVVESFFLFEGHPPPNMLSTSTWFENPCLWKGAGDTLVSTPFLLLAQECYWNGFLFQPLDETNLESLRKSWEWCTKPPSLVPMLTLVHEIAPCNIWPRSLLCEADPTGEVRAQFDQEEAALKRFQGHVRGYCLRKNHWSSIKEKCLLQKQHFLECAGQAYKQLTIKKYKTMRFVLRHWKSMARYLKLLSFRAAAIIQSYYRRHQAKKWSDYMKYRVNRANAIFLMGSQLHYDLTRRQFLHHWKQLFIETRNRRASSVVVNFLRTFGFTKKFYAAMDFICKAVRIHRKHTEKRMWIRWQKVYLHRVRIHAHFTIRFFVRDCMKRRVEAAAQTKLEERNVFDILAVIERNCFGKVRVRESWEQWKFALEQRKILHAKEYVATALPRLIRFRRWKSQDLVRRRRKWEIRIRSLILLRRHRLGTKIFFPWKREVFARVLQRGWRCAYARHRLAYLRERHARLMLFKRKVLGKLSSRVLFRMKKYNYLTMREVHRAARGISRFFRQCYFRSRLRRIQIRRLGHQAFVNSIHRWHQRRVFSQLKGGSLSYFRTQVFLRLFRLIRLHWMKCYFMRWNSQASFQLLGQQWRNKQLWLRMRDLLGRYSPPSYEMTEKPTLLQIQQAAFVQDMPICSRRTSLPKELWCVSRMASLPYFLLWAISCQLRYGMRKEGAPSWAKQLMQDWINVLHRRRLSALCIQKWIRKILCRRKFYCHRLARERRIQEIAWQLDGRMVYQRLMVPMKRAFAKRQASRRLIQRMVRGYLDRKYVHQLRNHEYRLQSTVSSFNARSTFRHRLLLDSWRQMVTVFVGQILFHGKLRLTEDPSLTNQNKKYASPQSYRNGFQSPNSTMGIGSSFNRNGEARSQLGGSTARVLFQESPSLPASVPPVLMTSASFTSTRTTKLLNQLHRLDSDEIMDPLSWQEMMASNNGGVNVADSYAEGLSMPLLPPLRTKNTVTKASSKGVSSSSTSTSSSSGSLIGLSTNASFHGASNNGSKDMPTIPSKAYLSNLLSIQQRGVFVWEVSKYPPNSSYGGSHSDENCKDSMEGEEGSWYDGYVEEYEEDPWQPRRNISSKCKSSLVDRCSPSSSYFSSPPSNSRTTLRSLKKTSTSLVKSLSDRMSKEELIACLQQASTLLLFLGSDSSSSSSRKCALPSHAGSVFDFFQFIYQWFHGSKMVVCGGDWSHSQVEGYLKALWKAISEAGGGGGGDGGGGGGGVEINPNRSLSMMNTWHWTDFRISFPSSLVWAVALLRLLGVTMNHFDEFRKRWGLEHSENSNKSVGSQSIPESSSKKKNVVGRISKKTKSKSTIEIDSFLWIRGLVFPEASNISNQNSFNFLKEIVVDVSSLGLIGLYCFVWLLGNSTFSNSLQDHLFSLTIINNFASWGCGFAKTVASFRHCQRIKVNFDIFLPISFSL